VPQSFIYINSFEFKISNLFVCWWPYSPPFMKPSVSLLCSQDPDTGLCTEPDYSSPWCISSCNIILILSCIPLLGLQNNLFGIDILTKLYQQFYSLFTSYISSSLVSFSVYCVQFIWISKCWY